VFKVVLFEGVWEQLLVMSQSKDKPRQINFPKGTPQIT
jgi:hypothetical protein